MTADASAAACPDPGLKFSGDGGDVGDPEMMTWPCDADGTRCAASGGAEVCVAPLANPRDEGGEGEGVLAVGAQSDRLGFVLSDLHREVTLVVVVYFLVYLAGWRTNKALATNWMRATSAGFKREFKEIGVCKGREETSRVEIQGHKPTKDAMYIDGPQRFQFYATGRKHCQGCLVTLDLKPRQDFLSLLYSLFYFWEDTLFIDVPVSEPTMLPFVFSIVRRVDLDFTFRTMQDVSRFARKVPLELLPRSLVCLTDCSELVPHFLTADVVKVFVSLQDYIEQIHLSDQNALSGYGPEVSHPRALRFRFRLPGSAEKCQVVMDLVYTFIDLVATAQMSQNAILQAENARAESKVRRKVKNVGQKTGTN
mmetsp:Transcript_6595/g.12181  ORF Transcript_6595/g.12181 Transcript_6595/m.12181 type:complete len:367 (-) Transcript_6595:74-1174(-)